MELFTAGSKMQQKGRRRPKPTKWQIYKRLKGITQHVAAVFKWDLLPPEVGMHILAFLQVRDLIRFTLVCKNWRDTILFSQYFKELHSRLCRPERSILYLAEYDPKEEPDISYPSIEYFYVCSSTILALHHPGLVFAQDGGFVCVSKIQDGNLMYEVGNPLINSWKTIPSPSDTFVPIDMMVDKLSGAYRILALGSKSHAEVYDSRENLWRKGGTWDYNAVPHNELIGSSPVFFSSDGHRVAIYDYEQDQSSGMIFDFPNASYYIGDYKHFVFKCKDRVMLVGLHKGKPKIEFWNGNTLNGTLKWTLMTKLDKAALKELIDKTERENVDNWINFYPTKNWHPEVALGKDDKILIAITRSDEEYYDDNLLLEYDLTGCFWKPIRIPDGLFFWPDNLSKEIRLMYFYPTLFLP